MVEVKFTNVAELDLENIYMFIAQNSEYFAQQTVENLVEASMSLQKFPELGRVIPEIEDENLRELLVSGFRLMYEIISAEKIDVLAIIHGARDFKKEELK